jgi:LysM repeat protein
VADTYVVKRGDSLWQIAGDHKVSFPELKKLNPQLAGRNPQYGINPGDVLKMPPSQQAGDIQQTCEKCKDCIKYQLEKPFLIALAKDPNIVSRVHAVVSDDFLKGGIMPLGQDATYGTGRAAPGEKSVGTEEGELKKTMTGLLDVFAGNDSDGKAKRLFEEFRRKNKSIKMFTDADLDAAAADHPNIIAFCNLTLAAPGTEGTTPGKIRIHQSLQSAGWDVNKVKLIDDLGVPAFNRGDKVWSTEDFGNGLGVMINSVQYVYVIVESYAYDSCKAEYEITLKFGIYDVFGLDDDDLSEYGSSGGWFSTSAGRGITAWWQLQHQLGYAPLLTKAVVRKKYTVRTDGK